jgi:hypothetical protein
MVSLKEESRQGHDATADRARSQGRNPNAYDMRANIVRQLTHQEFVPRDILRLLMALRESSSESFVFQEKRITSAREGASYLRRMNFDELLQNIKTAIASLEELDLRTPPEEQLLRDLRALVAEYEESRPAP